MATLIPKIDPATITNDGERIVATALLQAFDKHTLVFHSFPWLRRRKLDGNRREPLQQGEIDFVLLNRELGMLVLEVKGGDVRFDAESGEAWRAHGSGRVQELKESPFEQVRRNYHNLRDIIFDYPQFRLIGGEKRLLPFNSGYAVVLPTHRHTGPLPPDADPDILIDADGVEEIENGCEKRWNGGQAARSARISNSTNPIGKPHRKLYCPYSKSCRCSGARWKSRKKNSNTSPTIRNIC
ncbi:MAG: NERD domain-containing protein [Verrucomicrobiae bacterium]|nr:NERD domain-containing protein [Verrucomicrobiae bacterium]